MFRSLFRKTPPQLLFCPQDFTGPFTLPPACRNSRSLAYSKIILLEIALQSQTIRRRQQYVGAFERWFIGNLALPSSSRLRSLLTRKLHRETASPPFPVCSVILPRFFLRCSELGLPFVRPFRISPRAQKAGRRTAQPIESTWATPLTSRSHREDGRPEGLLRSSRCG